MSDLHYTLSNTSAAPIDEIPVQEFKDFAGWLHTQTQDEARPSAFFAVPEEEDKFKLYAVLAKDKDASLIISSTYVGKSYPSLTHAVPSLHLFERENYEQFGINPEGHPWLKPVRFEKEDGPDIGITEFFQVSGDDVHEVAVGPIHAGIIECGHFRFQCQGEIVMHLEISLGYHHRGIEKALNKPLHKLTLPLMEAMAGDTTIGHSWAYCSNIEALAGIEVTSRAKAIRMVALELERLANHTGDLGALAGDIGYLPTSSFCGRLRGDYLNMTAILCGNRFGRDLLTPGGTQFDLDEELCEELIKRLKATSKDTLGAADLLWKSNSVTARMLGRGILTPEAAKNLGLVGPAARASGLLRDVRFSHPLPGLSKYDIGIQTCKDGDVYCRAKVREKEIMESVAFIHRILTQLPETELCASPEEQSLGHTEVTPPDCFDINKLALKKNHMGISLIEGWRGEICHVAMTDEAGEICKYKVIDPSFHNWIGLALAMRLQQISDFPLCNKSFNLSYCGHDL